MDSFVTSVYYVNVCLVVVLLIFIIRHRITRIENEWLLLELKTKDKSEKILQDKLWPLEHLYGFLTLERLEERTCHKIKCLSTALEFIPKYYKGYVKLQRALKIAQEFHIQIEKARKNFQWKFRNSQLQTPANSYEVVQVLELANKSPSQQCPLEDFLRLSPIEYFFWNKCASGQRKKLDREYSKLKALYPDVPEAKLQRVMVFAYNYFKKNVFILKSKSLQETVKKLINADEELGHFDEEVDLCSICLEEINEDLRATLVCNHFFHPECIKTWLMEHDKCPICRHPQDKTKSL